MNEIMTSAFFDELGAIEKQAGIAGFLGAGLRGLGGLMMGKGVSAAAKGAGGHGNLIKKIYQHGAERVGKDGAKAGWWGGVKNVAGSRYGQMAAAAAVPIGAGYMAHKALS